VLPFSGDGRLSGLLLASRNPSAATRGGPVSTLPLGHFSDKNRCRNSSRGPSPPPPGCERSKMRIPRRILRLRCSPPRSLAGVLPGTVRGRELRSGEKADPSWGTCRQHRSPSSVTRIGAGRGQDRPKRGSFPEGLALVDLVPLESSRVRSPIIVSFRSLVALDSLRPVNGYLRRTFTKQHLPCQMQDAP
jgi:hypothetical protein